MHLIYKNSYAKTLLDFVSDNMDYMFLDIASAEPAVPLEGMNANYWRWINGARAMSCNQCGHGFTSAEKQMELRTTGAPKQENRLPSEGYV